MHTKLAEKGEGKETSWKERGWGKWENNIKTDGIVWTVLIGPCIDRPESSVANSKSTRIKLLSACNNIKRWCYRCENLRQTVNAADVVHESPLPCNQPIPLSIQTFLQRLWRRFSVTSCCLHLDVFTNTIRVAVFQALASRSHFLGACRSRNIYTWLW